MSPNEKNLSKGCDEQAVYNTTHPKGQRIHKIMFKLTKSQGNEN